MKEFDSPEEKDIFENSEVNDNKENNLKLTPYLHSSILVLL